MSAEVDAEATPVSDRILDAALEVAVQHGIARFSMGDVARTAGLSRQTVYRHFPNKDALVSAFVARETVTMMNEIAGASGPHDDPRSAIEAGLAAALRVTRDHPLLDTMIRTEPEALLPLLTTDGGPVMTLVRAMVESLVTERAPDLDLDPLALRRFADIVTRLLVSYAVSAPDDPPEVVAGYVASVLSDGIASLTLAATAARSPT